VPNSDPNWAIDALKIIGGFIAGAVTSRFAENLKLYLADQTGRTDEFCKLVDEVCERASVHWSKSHAGEAADLESDKLVSDLHRLEKLRIYCADGLPRFESAEAKSSLWIFEEVITSGDFQVQDRRADRARVKEIRSRATDLVIVARSARRHPLSLWKRAWAYAGSSK
jgi:hypothetical protein